MGSTSHLKIEIVETCRYKHVRDDCVGTAPTPWLTVEMLIAKSHLLSLEGGGAEPQDPLLSPITAEVRYDAIAHPTKE